MQFELLPSHQDEKLKPTFTADVKAHVVVPKWLGHECIDIRPHQGKSDPCYAIFIDPQEHLCCCIKENSWSRCATLGRASMQNAAEIACWKRLVKDLVTSQRDYRWTFFEDGFTNADAIANQTGPRSSGVTGAIYLMRTCVLSIDAKAREPQWFDDMLLFVVAKYELFDLQRKAAQQAAYHEGMSAGLASLRLEEARLKDVGDPSGRVHK